MLTPSPPAAPPIWGDVPGSEPVDLPSLSVDLVTDAYWSRVEPLLPPSALENLHKISQPPHGRGRKPVHPRQIFLAIIHVVVHRISWYELPEADYGLSYGTASIAFRRWGRDGFFARLHRAGLAPHREWEGVAWCWNKSRHPWAQITLAGDEAVKPLKARTRTAGRFRRPA